MLERLFPDRSDQREVLELISQDRDYPDLSEADKPRMADLAREAPQLLQAS
jgi:hypothetical protein